LEGVFASAGSQVTGFVNRFLSLTGKGSGTNHGYATFQSTSAAINALAFGLGYRPAFEGRRKQLRDAEHGFRVEFLVAGEFPGDGRPKPVAFPDPASCSIEIGGIRYVDLKTLLELKLAAGLTSPARLKDLADVQKLIRARDLPLEMRDQLDPYVRDKYTELWDGTRSL
jgi:hypothetical protein